jgi:hypothetical protein
MSRLSRRVSYLSVLGLTVLVGSAADLRTNRLRVITAFIRTSIQPSIIRAGAKHRSGVWACTFGRQNEAQTQIRLVG